jgi:hypothetical protein
MQWSVSCPGRFTPGDEFQGTHWIGDWVVPRDDLDSRGMENNLLIILGIKLRFLVLPARTLVPIPTELTRLTKISLEEARDSENTGVTCLQLDLPCSVKILKSRIFVRK